MKFRQLIVLLAISASAFSAQAAFVVGMSPAQIRVEITAQQAAGSDVAAVVASTATAAVNTAVQQAVAAARPLVPSSVPLATPTTQTLCSVSCS